MSFIVDIYSTIVIVIIITEQKKNLKKKPNKLQLHTGKGPLCRI